MGSGEGELQIQTVDFRGLSPSSPGGERWEAARAQVMAALLSLGCFEALYDGVNRETKEELFGRAAPELFGLPTATKMRNQPVPDAPLQGYVGQIPGMAYESLVVDGAPSLENVESFTSLMWPQGNPSFRNAAWEFAKQVQELEQMVQRMILQSMGVEKYYDSHIESLAYGLRLSEYGVPFNQETKIAMNSHVDMNMITIVCQYQQDGLEVQTRDGKWIHVVSQPNSFNIMIGDAFRAWSNGRLQPPYHRVRVIGNQKRYSIIFGTRPRDGAMVQASKELIDEEHPLLFMPYNYCDYLRFRFSDEGNKAQDPLQDFCGAGKEVEA